MTPSIHTLLKCVIVGAILIVLYKFTFPSSAQIAREPFTTLPPAPFVLNDISTAGLDNQFLYKVSMYKMGEDNPLETHRENWIGFEGIKNIIYIQYLDSSKVLLIDSNHQLYFVHFIMQDHTKKSYIQKIPNLPNTAKFVKVVNAGKNINGDRRILIISEHGHVYDYTLTMDTGNQQELFGNPNVVNTNDNILDYAYNSGGDSCSSASSYFIMSDGKLDGMSTPPPDNYRFINIVGGDSECDGIRFVGLCIDSSDGYKVKLYYIDGVDSTVKFFRNEPDNLTMLLKQNIQNFQMSFQEHKDTSGNLDWYHVFITFPLENKATIIRIHINKVIHHYTINNVTKYAHLRDGHYVYRTHTEYFNVYPKIDDVGLWGYAELNRSESHTSGSLEVSKFTINFINWDNRNYNNIQLFTGDSVNNMFILMNDFDARELSSSSS